MTRTICAALFILSGTGSTSFAGGCERYQFGSQEWWQCTTHEQSGPS